LICIS